MDILGKLKSLLEGIKTIQVPTDSVIGIDIGSAVLKVVEVSKVGPRLTLRTYGEVALGPYGGKSAGMAVLLDAPTMSKAILDVMKDAQIETRQAVVAISSTQSLLFFLELPKAAEVNLAEIIPNEARKFIPVPISEVRLDWLVVPPIYDNLPAQNMGEVPVVSPEDKVSVLVAAIRAEALAYLKEVTDMTKIVVRSYELEVFAQVRATLYRELSPAVVIDIGAQKSRFAVVRHGVVYVNHVASIGGEQMTSAVMRATNLDFAQAEEIKRLNGVSGGDTRVTGVLRPLIGQLVSELKSVISEFEKTHGLTVEKAVMIGGGSQLAGLQDLLTESLGLLVVRSSALSRLDKPAFMEETLQKIDPEFVTSVGLAMRNFE